MKIALIRIHKNEIVFQDSFVKVYVGPNLPSLPQSLREIL